VLEAVVVQHQEPASIAPFRRMERDQRIGQVVVE
jgi:hypothetical protein